MARVGAGNGLHPQRRLFGAAVRRRAAGASRRIVSNHGPPGLGGVGRNVQAHSVLVLVEVMDQIGLLVVPADAEVGGLEHLAQLVADQIDDRLEVELGRHALLDAVDDRELVRALLDERVRRLQLLGALRDLLLESLRPLRVVERHGGLAREHAEEVAIGFAEPSECAVEVGVEVAQDLPLRDQRRDDARALVELGRAVGAVRQASRRACGAPPSARA